MSQQAIQRFDAVIVGAGPAGSVAAHQLARRGRSVLLVDRAKFPRPKVCGGCLGYAAIETLRELGIRIDAPHTERLRLRAGTARAEVPLPPGLAIGRDDLDQQLVDAALRMGAEFRDGTTARLAPPSNGHRDGVDQSEDDDAAEIHRLEIGGRPIETRVLIAADGLGGKLLADRPGFKVTTSQRSRIGLGGRVAAGQHSFEAGVIYMHTHRYGYAGGVVLGDGSLNVAAALDPAWVRDTSSPACAIARTVGQEWADVRWRGTPLLTRQRRQVAGPRLLVIGDAAGYVEPFTGEGMAWAITGAIAAAAIADEGVERWPAELTARWQAEHRKLIRRRQLVCRAVAATLRRPPITRATVHLLGIAPRLATPLVQAMHRPRPTSEPIAWA